MWPLRSMLFIPAHKLEWVRTVGRFKPDSVVIDLEDAVPPALKVEARGMAREGIGMLHQMGIPAFVRINEWGKSGRDDVVAVATRGFSGVMLPKAHDVQQIRELDITLAYAEGAAGLPLGSLAIMPLPETAEGLVDARQLAAASARCRGVIGVVGGVVSGDVARAAGYRPTVEGTEQLYLQSKMVLDSRAGGALYPMASIIGTRLDDHDAVRRLVIRAKSFGYAGAVLIHPGHVQIANEIYAPTPAEVEYAQGLLEAMRAAEKAGDGAVRFRGMMVDYAMMPEAEGLLREAQRRGIEPAPSPK